MQKEKQKHVVSAWRQARANLNSVRDTFLLRDDEHLKLQLVLHRPPSLPRETREPIQTESALDVPLEPTAVRSSEGGASSARLNWNPPQNVVKAAGLASCQDVQRTDSVKDLVR